jgi:hypothetical protein
MFASVGLQNPLGMVRVCVLLEKELASKGFYISQSTDFQLLNETRLNSRGGKIGPMHDPNLCDFSKERAFWMGLHDETGRTVGLQAYRLDYVETSLADWLPNYMIGVYMRRNEVMVPSHPSPPRGSISERLRGKLVYEGELWLDKQIKGRQAFDMFTRLGLFLATIKWNPDAIWGLASEQMAKHGHLGRIGFTILERGVLRWTWASDGIDLVEYLAVIEKQSIEQLLDEMLTSEGTSEILLLAGE